VLGAGGQVAADREELAGAGRGQQRGQHQLEQARDYPAVAFVGEEADVDAEPSGFERSADPVDAPGEAAQQG
jgi:hypothetical protein